MPRKVTKTMREARARARQQRAERRSFQASLSEQDFQWGVTRTGRFTATRPNKSADPKTRTEDLFIPDTVTELKGKTHTVVDVADHERRVIAAMTPEEYREREKVAQQEIDRKKLCIAPAYNKGAYQYIGSESMARDAGKK